MVKLQKLLVFLLCMLFLFPTSLILYFFLTDLDSNDNPLHHTRIIESNYKAVLIDEPDSNSKVIITEQITFDVFSAFINHPFWELHRPLISTKPHGLDANYKVNSVKQILDDGTKIQLEKSPKFYSQKSEYDGTSTEHGPNKWIYGFSPKPYDYKHTEALFIYINGIFKEKLSFEIEYELNNPALKYDDCSKFYLPMYHGEASKYLKSAKGQILIPNKDMPAKGNYDVFACSTYDNFDFIESDTQNPGYHTFSFDLDKSELKSISVSSFIDFYLISHGTDKHIFADYAPDHPQSNTPYLTKIIKDINTIQNTNYNPDFFDIKYIIFLVCLAASPFFIISTLKLCNKLKNTYQIYEPTAKCKPSNKIPNNLDPLFVANLFSYKKNIPIEFTDKHEIILLNLIRKGYIDLELINPLDTWEIGNLKIVVKDTSKQKLEPLFATEKIIYELILKHTKTTLTNSNIKNSTKDNDASTKEFNNEIEFYSFEELIYTFFPSLSSHIVKIDFALRNAENFPKYFQPLAYPDPKENAQKLIIPYLLLGIIFLTAVNIFSSQTHLEFAFGGYSILGITFLLCSIYLYKKTKKYSLLSQLGENEHEKWKSLYHFLNQATFYKNDNYIDVSVLEKYFVYSSAFDISNKVIPSILKTYPEIVASSPILSNNYYTSGKFFQDIKYIRDKASTTHRTSFDITTYH